MADCSHASETIDANGWAKCKACGHQRATPKVYKKD